MTNNRPEHFEIEDRGHGCLRLRGRMSLAETVGKVDDAIWYCRQAGIKCLLADLTGVTGFDSPTLAQRFQFISRWADTSGGRVIVSVVVREELILPDKFGVLIAANRGLISDVHSDESVATEWLTKTCIDRAGKVPVSQGT
jgi:hypothetical protein